MLKTVGMAITARFSGKLTNLASFSDWLRVNMVAGFRVSPNGLFVNDLLLRP